MSKNVNRRFTLDLDISTKNAEAKVKAMAGDIKTILADLGGSKNNKMGFFKELVDYLEQVDSQIMQFKKKHGDGIFEQIFGGLDENLRKEVEKIFGTTRNQMSQIAELREKIANAKKNGISDDEAKALEQTVRDLYKAVGMEGKANLSGKGKTATRLSNLEKSLNNFASVWQDVNNKVSQGFTIGGAGGLGGDKAMLEIEKRIKDTEKRMEGIKDAQEQLSKMKAAYKEFTDVEMIDDTIDTTVEAVKDLVAAYDAAIKKREMFEASGDSTSSAYYENELKIAKMALQAREFVEFKIDDEDPDDILAQQLGKENFNGKALRDILDDMSIVYDDILGEISSTIKTAMNSLQNELDALNRSKVELANKSKQQDPIVQATQRVREIKDLKEEIDKKVGDKSLDDEALGKYIQRVGELSSGFRNLAQSANLPEEEIKDLESVLASLGAQLNDSLAKVLKNKGKNPIDVFYDDSIGEMKDKIREIAKLDKELKMMMGPTQKMNAFDKSNPSDMQREYILEAFREYQKISGSKEKGIPELAKLRQLFGIINQASINKASAEDYQKIYGLDGAELKAFVNMMGRDQSSKISGRLADQLAKAVQERRKQLINALGEENKELSDLIMKSTPEWTKFLAGKKEDFGNPENVTAQMLKTLEENAAKNAEEKKRFDELKNQFDESIKSFTDTGIINVTGNEQKAYNDVLDGIRNKTIKTVDECKTKFAELAKLDYDGLAKKNEELIAQGKGQGTSPGGASGQIGKDVEESKKDLKELERIKDEYISIIDSLGSKKKAKININDKNDAVVLNKTLKNMQQAFSVWATSKNGTEEQIEAYGRLINAAKKYQSVVEFIKKGGSQQGKEFLFNPEVVKASKDADAFLGALDAKQKKATKSYFEKLLGATNQDISAIQASSNAVDSMGKTGDAAQKAAPKVKLLTDSFNEYVTSIKKAGNVEWSSDIQAAYKQVFDGIKKDSFSTVEECIAKFKELANITEVVKGSIDGSNVANTNGGFATGSFSSGTGAGNDINVSALQQTISAGVDKIVGKLNDALKVDIVKDNTSNKTSGDITKTDLTILQQSVNKELKAISNKLDSVLKVNIENDKFREIIQTVGATKEAINSLVSELNKTKTMDAESAKQAEIHGMKQNLTELLNRVNQLNSKTDAYGNPQRQELSAQFMSNGTIATAYGERGSVPWDRVVAQLVKHLESRLIMDVHSHPMHFNKDNVYKYANDHFSGSHGDLAAWQASKRLGAQMTGMITGNILRTFNVSALNNEQYKKFVKNLSRIEQEYSKDSVYGQYMGIRENGSTYYKEQTDLAGRHMVTKMFEDVMYEALKQTGLSVDKINQEIFHKYDLTDDAQLTQLATTLVELNNAAHTSISPVQRLSDILQSLKVDTSSSNATTALLGFEKGEMSAADVINELAPIQMHITDELVNAVQTIDYNNKPSIVETTLNSILDVLSTINKSVSSLQASIKPDASTDLSSAIDDILKVQHGARLDNDGLGIKSIYDENNISEYQVDSVLRIAKDAVGETMSKILLSDGADLGISEVNDLVLSFKTALSYVNDAAKQVARYDKIDGLHIKTNINGTPQRAEEFVANLRKTLLNVDDVINPLLGMLNNVRAKVQSAEDAYGIGTVKTSQTTSGNRSVKYESNVDVLQQEQRELNELIQFLNQVKVAVDAKTLSFEKEGTVVQSVIQSEENQLDILEVKIGRVTDAIDNKTGAFVDVKGTVESVVESEVNELEKLRLKLVEVQNAIKSINDFGAIGSIVNNKNQEAVVESETFKGYNLSSAFNGMDLKGFIKRSVNKDSEKQLEDEFYKFAKAFIDEDADAMYSQASNIADFIVENSKAFRERKEENIYEDAFKAIRVAYTDDDVAAMGPQLFERAKSILGRRFQKLSDKNKHFDRIDQLVHTLASNYPSLFDDPDGNESAYNKLEQLLDPFDSWKRDGVRKTRDVYLDENDVQGIIDHIYSEVLPPMMANIDEQRAAINAKGGLDQVSIGGFQDIQKDTNNIQQSSLSNEIAQLENLRKKLGAVKKAIIEKTEAFKEEGAVADTVIGGEIQSLHILWESLDLVAKQIDRIVTDLSYINSQNIQVPNDGNEDIEELDTNKKQHIETQIDSAVKDYALDSTLQTTNSILNEISSKLNQEQDFSSLINPLKGAVNELKDAASGIAQHQKAQKNDTSAAMARISDPKKHQMIIDVASNSIGDLGSDVQIKGLKALANGIVSVEGAFKNANDEWEGFTVKVNESNKAVDLAINKQSAFAKALSKVKVVDDRTDDNPHKISASETEKRAFLHAMGYADQGEDVTIKYQDNERYTVALRKNIGALQKEVFQTFDDGIADFDERTTVTISTKAQAALKNTNKFITENMKLLGDNKVVTEYAQAYADLLQITNEFQTTDDLSDSAIEKWNKQIDLVNNLGAAITNLIKIEQKRDPEKEAKKADDAVFSKMKEKKKNIGKYQTNLAGLDEKSEADIPVINEIKETLVILNNEYAALENQLKKPLSTEQLKELSEIAEKTADDIRLARAKMEGSIAAKNKKDIKKADDDAAKRSQKEIDTAFSEMEKKKKAIGALEVALAKLDKGSKKDAPKIEKIINILERLNQEYAELEGGFGEFLSGKQVDKLNSITQDTADKISLANADKEGTAAKKDSSDATEKLKSDFKKLKSLAKEMGKIEAQIAGSKDEDEIRGLTNILDKLKTEYEELYSVTNKKLDPAQINTLNQIFADTIGTVRDLKKEIADLSAKEASDLELFKSGKDKRLSQFDLDKTNLEKDGPIDAKYDVAGARAAIENATDNNQLTLAMNAWSKLKNEIKQAAIEAKRLSDVQKEAEARAKAPQEKFKADLDSQLDAYDKYEKNLEGAGYITTELSNKVEELKAKFVSIDNAADLTAWQKEFKELGHEIDVAKAKWTGQHNDNAKKYNKQIEDAFKGLGFSDVDSGLSAEQQEVVQAYNKAKEAVREYKKNVKDGNQVEVSGINATIEALERKAKAYKVNNNISDVSAKKFGATAVRREATRAHKMQSLAFDLDSGYSSSDEFMRKYHEYTIAYDKLIDKQKEFAGLDILTNEQVAEWDRLKDTCVQAGKELERLYNASEKLKNNSGHHELLGEDFIGSDEGRKRALTDYVKSLIDADIESIKFKNDYTQCVAVVKESDGTFKHVSATIDTFGNQMVADIDDLGKSTSTLGNIWDEFKRKVSSIGTYLMAMFGFEELIQQFRQGISYVREIDAALTDLKKVTSGTEEEYNAFLQSMSKTASVVGSTVADLTTMSAEWARLGYSMKEAGELAESTAILLNVSEFEDATQASEALISTMQAFSYTADESQHVVDVLNEVGNNYAVSSDGIATALQDSASALMEAGNNLEQSVALIAAANKVVQDPNSVGSALRTISLRIRGTSVEVLEQLGEETDGVVESTSKLQEKIKALTGVDILTDSGAYKDTYTILKDIGKAWENIDPMDQAAALELLAGKNRANTLAAILNNTKDLENAYKSAMNAEGSALKENETYLDSIQGHVDILTNSTQTMWMNFINSDVAKFLVDVVNGLVKLIDTIGVIPSLSLVFSPFKSTLDDIKKAFREIDDAPVKAIELFTVATEDGTAATMRDTLALQANAVATKANTVATKALAAVKSIGKGLLIGAAVAAATAAISGLINVITEATQRMENLTDQAINSAKETKDLQDSTSDYKLEIKQLRKELDSNALSEAEAYDARSRLIDIQNELIDKFGLEAEGLNLVTGAIGDQINAIDELSKKSASDWMKENIEAYENAKKVVAKTYDSDREITLFNQFGPDANNLISGTLISTSEEVIKEYKKGLEKIVEDKYGGTINEAEFTSDHYSTTQYTKYIKASFDGKTVEQLDKILDDIQTYMLEFEESYDGANLSTEIANIQKLRDKYADEEYRKARELYEEGRQQEAISKYADAYGAILDAQEAIYDADTDESRLKAIEEYNKKIEAAKNQRTDDAYMDDYFDSLAKGFAEQEFELRLKVSKDDENGLRAQLENIVKESGENGLSSLDNTAIFDMINRDLNVYGATDVSGKYTQEQIDGLAKLQTEADKAGISIQDLINILVNFGIIAGKSIEETTESVSAIDHAYSTLASSVEQYASANEVLNEAIYDNVEITQEQYDALHGLIGSEEEFADCFDANNKLVVKNTALLRKLVAQKKQDQKATIQQAKSSGQLQYRNTVQQLQQVIKAMALEVRATGIVSDATLDTVDVLKTQLTTLKQTIQQYALLELSLSDAANAYSEFEAAKERDAQLTYGDSMIEALQTINDGFKTGKVGTEAFQAAVKIIVPESEYAHIDDIEQRMIAIHDYIDKNPLFADWFTIDEGEFSITIDNINSFIDDAHEAGLFTNDSSGNFFLTDEIKNAKEPLKEFADQLGNAFNTEVADGSVLAMLTEMEKYDASWGNILTDLTTTELDRNINDATDALYEALTTQEEFVRSGGDLNSDEYKTLVDDVNSAQIALNDATKAAELNAQKYNQIETAYAALTGEITLTKEAADSLFKSLGFVDQNGNVTIQVDDDGTIHITDEQLKTLKARADEITSEPTVMDVQFRYDTIDAQIAELQRYIDEDLNFEDSEIAVTLGIKNEEEAKAKVAELTSEQETISLNYNITATTEEQSTGTLEKLTTWETNGLNINISGNTEKLQGAVQEANALEAEDKNVDITADPTQANADIDSVDNNEIEDKEPKIIIQGVPVAISEIDSVYDELDKLNDKTIDISVNKTTYEKTKKWNSKTQEWESNADGNFHIYGGAFAGGSVGAPKTETALMGELGPELLVRNGRWTTVGENGAEFTQVRRGDIIFNHKQTEELLSKGYVTSRGKLNGGNSAFANGTIPNSTSGTAYYRTFGGYVGDDDVFENGSENWMDPYTNTSDSLSDAADSLSDAADSLSDTADEFREVFDWIEVRLGELEETLGLLSAQLENASNYSEQNNIIDSIIGVNQNKMDNLAAGIAEYAEYASKLLNEVPAQFREAAQNGAIAITDFAGEANEATVEAINNYREWAQKVADLKQQLEETKTEIRDLARQKFDNVYEAGDVRATVEDSQTEKLQNAVDLIEESGKIATEEYYLAMMENSNKTIEYLTKTRDQMQKVFDEAVEAGIIVRGSNEWYEMIDQLYQVDAEIDEATRELEEFQNAINDIYWDNFDQLINRLEYLKNESQGLIDLMDNDDLVDESGSWTDEGLASLGLHAQQMEIAEYQARQYAEAIDDLSADYKAGLYSEDEYLEKLDELKNAQYESIEAYEEAKEAIVDLNKTRVDAIKKGIEKEIDAYEELINKKKEALESEKDLYDFQKSTMEQQKTISEIERQLAALANDNSLSAAAKRKQLEAELAEAQYELQDTYYNRSVEDKQSALDKELESFRTEKEAEITAWEEYLTNIETVVAESLGIVQENATGIYDTLMAKASEYDLTISDAIMTPWQDGAFAVSDYQDQFNTAMSSTMNQLEALKNKWQEVIDKMLEASKAEVSAIHKENNDYASAEKKQETSKPSTPPASNKKEEKKEKSIVVGGKVNAKGAKIYSSIGGKGYNQYYGNDPVYQILDIDGNWLKVRHHSLRSGVTGWFKKGDVKAYASGTKKLEESGVVNIDELGEELILRAHNGRLTYMEKGSGIVPADLTSNLMEWGALDPSTMLEQNRPAISISPEVNNTEIHLDCSVGTLLHIDEFNGDNPDAIAKIVAKEFEKHTKNINNALRKYVR